MRLNITVYLSCVLLMAACSTERKPLHGVYFPDSATGGAAYVGHLVEGMTEKVDPNHLIRVVYSSGGKFKSAKELAKRRVIVDGPCQSACAFMFVINEQACFTDAAEFLFHVPYTPRTFLGLISYSVPHYAAMEEYLRAMRPALRAKVEPITRSREDVLVSSAFMRVVYPDRYCDVW